MQMNERQTCLDVSGGLLDKTFLGLHASNLGFPLLTWGSSFTFFDPLQTFGKDLFLLLMVTAHIPFLKVHGLA